MDICKELMTLCSLDGPSGFEKETGEYLKGKLSEYMDEVKPDRLGNIVGVRYSGKENAKKLLLDAHIDEIGFIITGAEDGFLRFSTVGGFDLRMLPAARVKILTEPVITGVIPVMPPHVLSAEQQSRAIKLDDMYIDAGFPQDELEKLAPPGTYAVYHSAPRLLGDGNICAKALDDRAGVAAILAALDIVKDEKLDIDLYVLGSVQEEVGTRGARTGAFAIAPDYCISVDVGHAKTLDSGKSWQVSDMGEGVVISKGPNMNAAFTESLINTAKENDIKYQISVEPSGDSGTNARAIQIAREGVATALLSIPLKYMHTPFEVASLGDIESCARLIAREILTLNGRGGVLDA